MLIMRDVKKAGEGEDWKKKTGDRGGGKRISDEAVKKLRAEVASERSCSYSVQAISRAMLGPDVRS